MTDKFERNMWIGLGITFTCMLIGSVCTLIFKDFMYFVFGSGSALIVWTIFCLYHNKYSKNPVGVV